MTPEGTLMEPTAAPPSLSGPSRRRLVSVIVPVVERADDLMALYHAFAGELDRRGEEYEFLFVFDGGFEPAPGAVALSRETPSVRLFSFARAFGETAALRLGIERSRGDVIVTLPAYFQVQPEGIGPLLDGLPAAPTWWWPTARRASTAGSTGCSRAPSTACSAG